MPVKPWNASVFCCLISTAIRFGRDTRAQPGNACLACREHAPAPTSVPVVLHTRRRPRGGIPVRRILQSLAAGSELDVAYVSADTNRNLRETFSLVGFTRSFQVTRCRPSETSSMAR